MAQLVQAQAVGAHLITGAFNATSGQALNIEAYLTPINLELDKKMIDSYGSSPLFRAPLIFNYSKPLYTGKTNL